MRIYLSPSNQPSNKYAVGNTNEKAEMEALAAKVKAVLDSEYDCETVMATLSLGINANERPQEAANKKCDFYLAIHSNAAGTVSQNYASGACTFYHPDSAKSKALATALIKELNAVCPVKSNRSSPVVNGMSAFNGSGYGEVRSPMQKGVGALLLEVDFHDNQATAAWIINNKDVIVRAIVTAVVEVFGVAKKVTAPAKPTETGKLYRVQVGAFAVKSNAENLLVKLRQQGYSDAYIVEVTK